MSTRKEHVLADLRAAGATHAVIEQAIDSLNANYPPKTYTVAVWFLGSATIILIAGAVASVLLGKETSDALWTAVGAGLGGLAGIFTGKSDS
jgi:hypothetical protein